jgi:hypothetical protein
MYVNFSAINRISLPPNPPAGAAAVVEPLLLLTNNNGIPVDLLGWWRSSSGSQTSKARQVAAL